MNATPLTDEMTWAALPMGGEASLGARWCVAVGDSGRPARGARVFEAALVDAGGHVLLPAELWVQEVWSALRPMAGVGVGVEQLDDFQAADNGSIDAAWRVMGGQDAWQLGPFGDALDAGPLLRWENDTLAIAGEVQRDPTGRDRQLLPSDGEAVELSPEDAASYLNPGGGRMRLRPTAGRTLGDHLRRLELAAGGGEGLLLSGRDSGSRWIELFHLKLRLIWQLATTVKRATESAGGPLLNMEAGAFEIEVPPRPEHMPPGADATPWLARPRLASTAGAVRIDLGDDEPIYLARPVAGWPEPRRQADLDVQSSENGIITGRITFEETPPTSAAIRLRLGKLDTVAIVVGSSFRARGEADVSEGQAASWCDLETGTVADDVAAVGRLALSVLFGNHAPDAGQVLRTAVAKMSRGRDKPLDDYFRDALRSHEELRGALGPQRLAGGWQRVNADLAETAGEAVPTKAWARLLTTTAATLGPHSSDQKALAAFDSLVRNCERLLDVTQPLLVGTWRLNRDVAEVLREVAGVESR